MNTLFFVLIASLCGLSNVLAFPVVSRSAINVPILSQNQPIKLFGKLATTSATTDASDAVTNFQDTVYATNITIGGYDMLIQLDTGSSDLWVYVPEGLIETTNVTSISASETYGIGEVVGPIALANVTLGPHTVPSQAYINATNATDFGTIFGDGINGILGLAFDGGSTVDIDILEAYGVNSSIGHNFITNVFLQNSTMPHLFTVQLGRTDDPEYTTEGYFTIGEYISGLESVADQPQLPRFPNYNNLSIAEPRWSTVLSGMTVGGEPFQFNTSGVPGTPNGSVVAVLDTGFTFPPLPEAAVTFIYSQIEGAYFDNTSSLWVVPCNGTTDLEFQFDNLSVPIHPLDLTVVQELNNETVCVNTFRASTFPLNDQFDVILGDAFLKNVYASFNYGNWSTENPDAIPYIQLLPTTNYTTALAEFQEVRSQEVAAFEATASVSATSAVTTSVAATSAVATATDTMIPTTSVLYTSAWSSYPSSTAWTTYITGTASLSLPLDAASPTSSVSVTSANTTDSSSDSSDDAAIDSSTASTTASTTNSLASLTDPDSVDSSTGPSLDTASDSSASDIPSNSYAGSSAGSTPSVSQSNFSRFQRRGMFVEPTRTMADCIAPLVAQYGAVLFALLIGSLIVSIVLCIVSVVIAIRNHCRLQARRRASYSLVKAKSEVEADPEADVLSATYLYNDSY